MNRLHRRAMVLTTLGLAALLSACERPPVETVQRGYRGVGMLENFNPRLVADQAAVNTIPVVAPALPGGGPKAGAIYKNVQVLGDVDVSAFVGTMTAMTAWVAPEQGCSYCHDPADLASDKLYTKVVARRMLQMTQHVNRDWQSHVAGTGVTCYTCHRGQPVPANVWFTAPGPASAEGMAGNHAGKNAPGYQVGLASLPYDPLTTYFDQGPADIRVVGQTALPEGNRHSIKQTEWTYALMMNMSKSLGVNCTYCHNSRSFTDWDQSTPQRATAWYGIRMVRELNTGYLDPLAATLPDNRHGPVGDGPKVACATCHQGAYKPLYGASMIKDFPALNGLPWGTIAPSVRADGSTPTTAGASSASAQSASTALTAAR